MVAWAAVISVLSTDSFQGSQTDAILRPLFRFLLPTAPEATLDLLHAAVRKLAHLTEYAILGVLVLRALEGPPRPRRRALALACALCAAYAAIDELHQTWVPSRTGAALDVLLDAAGATLGIALRARTSPGQR